MIRSLLLKTRTRVININGQFITPMQPRPAKNFSKLLPHTSALHSARLGLKANLAQIGEIKSRSQVPGEGGEIKKLFIPRENFIDVMKNIDISPAVRIIPSVAVHDTN